MRRCRASDFSACAGNGLLFGPDDTDSPAAGDRKLGDFDFFDLSPSGEGYAWALRAQYDTQRGVLTRVA